MLVPTARPRLVSSALTRILAALALNAVLLCPAWAALVSWDGGGDALSWNNALNWSGNAVPTGADSVTIGSGFTVRITTSSAALNLACDGTLQVQSTFTLGSTSSVNNLQVTSGTLTVTGDLTVTGSLTWSNATMTGAGTTILAPGATGTFNTTIRTLLSRTFRNEGYISWTAGSLTLSTGGIWDNMAGSTLDIRSNVTLAQTGTGNGFRNYGTVLRSAGTGNADISANFSNYVGGLVRGETGTVRLVTNLTNSGQFEFLPGTVLQTFGGGSRTFDATSSLIADVFNVGGDDGFHPVTISGNYDVTNTIVDFCGSCGVLPTGTGLFITHPDTMTNLTLNDDSRLSVDGDLLITGALTWNEGFHQGPGTTTLAPGATALLATSGLKTIEGRTLLNKSNAIWSDGGISLRNGGRIENLAGALFEARGVTTMVQVGSGNAFVNYGEVRRTTSTGRVSLNAPFVNTVAGLVRGETGIVRYGSNLTNSGRFEFLPGTTLEAFGGGGKVFDATSSLTASTFNVGVDDGFITVTISGNYDVTNTIVDFCGSCGLLPTGTGLFITHPDTMTNLTLNDDSRLSVDGDLLITGALTWNEGFHQGPGTTTLAPGATALLATAGAKIIEGRTFLNKSNAIWSDGGISLRNGGRIENLAGALFEARGITTMDQVGSGNAFVNYGEVRQTTTTGRVSLHAPFVNTVAGLVRGETGIVRYGSSLTNSGRFEFLPGTTLETFGTASKVLDATSSLTASTFNVGLDDGYHTVTISGNYDVTNTIVDFCSTCGPLATSSGLFITHPDTLPNLTLDHRSRLSVVGDLLITGALTWNEGFHEGSGTTTLAPGATALLATSGLKVLDGRTLRSETTVSWNGGGFQLNNGSRIDNYGTFLARFDGIMARVTGTQTSYFNNLGLFRKEASTGTTNIDGGICFVNTGVVDVDTGILRFSGCYPSFTGTYNVASTLQIDSVPVPDCTEASITLETAGAQVLNALGQSLVGDLDCIDTTGSITVQGGKNYVTDGALENSGALTIETASAVTVNGNYTQLAGTTLVEDGTLTAPLIDIAGGLVRAQGLFNGNTRNAGRLEIGVPVGKLDIAGWYEQTAAGTLAFDIGGTIPIVEYDQLDISGLATFNGTLEVQLVNGFMPAPGDSFQIILYGSHTGVFANLVLPALAAGLQWEIDYGATAVTLYITVADFILTATAGQGGIITPSGADTVTYGESPSYTITPDACYQVADVLVDNVSVGAVTSYTFDDVAANHTIEASFALIPYTITASAGSGGDISPSGGVAVSCGADQSFTITPDACYQVADVLVDNVSVGAVTGYTFEDVAASHTIEASFALFSYTITASAGTGGGISPGGAVSVNCGADQSFTITPDACYQVADVLVDNVSVGAVTGYAFTNVTANHTIAASFVQISYTINASAGSGGGISPSGGVSVNCGADQSFTITPDACYQVADVLVDNVSVGAVTGYTFEDVAANHTIEASFALVSYTITASAGTGGGISPGGGVSVNCGADQSFTITPDACYQVADVLVDNVSVGAVTSYAFTNVTASHTITASFAPIPYTINASAGSGGGISPSGGVSVNCGNDQSFIITPDLGYVVSDVLVNGFSIGAVTTYDFTGVNASQTIAASFALDHPTEVTVSGTVSSDCNGPLLGVTVDLIDAQGGFHTTTTNAAGAYVFAGIPYSADEGAAEVSIAIPLGYEAVSPGVAGQALTLDHDQVVSFTLACLDPTGPPRSMGYWKHNANVYLSGKGNAQESQANMTINYPQSIFNHFYENGLNDIPVQGVTYMGAPAGPLDLPTISATLTVNNGGTMLARAKQQYLAYLLNIASGKLGTSTVVTADGGTASQVLQYVADLINDGITSNDETAKNLCDTINNARLVAAGLVPLGQYDTIAYARDRLANLPLRVSPNPGGTEAQVFSFGMSSGGEAVLEIYDVNGRRVATPLSDFLDAGEHRVPWSGTALDGQPVAGGIYFGRVVTPEGMKTVRFVRLGR